MSRIRIRTPSRLHFGLLGWGPSGHRQFGGVGLMIDAPGIELIAEPASEWRVLGPLANRVETLVGCLRVYARQAGTNLPPARIQIVQAPREHVGLGVGTQLSLAAALAVLELSGETAPGAERLARLTGRGYRSGIGLHGFRHGGLIVDGGRKQESDIPPLLTRAPFPDDWSILIVQPPGPSGLHGPEEIRAFADLPAMAPGLTDRLCRLVLLGILPAVIEHDLPAFAAAVCELQTHMGACFTPAQGGPYTAPAAATLVDELRHLGFVGVGQSSWGPTLYAFSDRKDADLVDATDCLRRRLGLDHSSFFWTKADNRGVQIVASD